MLTTVEFGPQWRTEDGSGGEASLSHGTLGLLR